MSRSVNKLTARQVQAAKPKDKEYKLSDGGGLYFNVRKSGSRAWIFRYRKPATGKPTNAGLGPFPEISLSEAREIAAEYRAALREGMDPQIKRASHLAAMAAAQGSTFKAVAEEWLESKKGGIKDKTYDGHVQKLNKHAYPQLGKIPVDQLTAPMAIQALRPLEREGKLETVKRTCAIINNVMVHAVNSGLIHHNPLTGIGEVFKKPKAENLPVIHPRELPELLKAVAMSPMNITTRCLFELQMLTMTRPNEAAGAMWEEFDLEERVWYVSKDRMKAGRLHKIPLSDKVMEIIEILKAFNDGSGFLFPSNRSESGHVDAETLNRALRRAGYANRQCAHTLRTLASTILNEHEFNKDVIEISLAHGDEDKIRSTYNKAEWIKQRFEMLQWWAEYVENASVSKVSLSIDTLRNQSRILN